jgi:hypothetical protein
VGLLWHSIDGEWKWVWLVAAGVAGFLYMMVAYWMRGKGGNIFRIVGFRTGVWLGLFLVKIGIYWNWFVFDGLSFTSRESPNNVWGE